MAIALEADFFVATPYAPISGQRVCVVPLGSYQNQVYNETSGVGEGERGKRGQRGAVAKSDISLCCELWGRTRDHIFSCSGRRVTES